jgi:putative membrane protein
MTEAQQRTLWFCFRLKPDRTDSYAPPIRMLTDNPRLHHQKANPMKTRSFWSSLLLLATAPTLRAADAATPSSWHAHSLGQALGYMLLFAAVGIVAAIVGYKIFDKCTPGDLNKEILENKNVAAAIVAAAVILGVCIIIAASMLG